MTNRKETLKVLLAAKKRLIFARFVCVAADYAEEDGAISKKECERFKDMISERICGEYTVNTWLRRYHGIDTVNYNYAPNVMLEYRHRWMDAMIEEFS
jgi:hypothetical protein